MYMFRLIGLVLTVAPIFYYPLVDTVPRQDNRVFYNAGEDQLSFFKVFLSLFLTYGLIGYFRLKELFH